MTAPVSLSAARQLTLHFDATPHWRVAWDDPDWLGPIGFTLQSTTAPSPTMHPQLHAFDGSDDLGAYRGLDLAWDGLSLPLRTTVRAYAGVPLVVFRLEALDHLDNLTTGSFEQPSVSWPAFRPQERIAGGVLAGTRSYGHQYAEFALPVSGDANCGGFFFAPHRPPVVEPLLFIAPDGRTLLLAPLDHFHEQIIAVPPTRPRGDGVRCGWHGDLERGARRASRPSWRSGPAPARAQLLDEWAALLRRRHGTQRPSRYADDRRRQAVVLDRQRRRLLLPHGTRCDYTTTLERVVADLHARDVPVAFGADRLVVLSAPASAPGERRGRADRAAERDDDAGSHARTSSRTACVICASGWRTCRSPFTAATSPAHSPYFERHAAWRDGDYAHPADGDLYDLLHGASRRLGRHHLRAGLDGGVVPRRARLARAARPRPRVAGGTRPRRR